MILFGCRFRYASQTELASILFRSVGTTPPLLSLETSPVTLLYQKLNQRSLTSMVRQLDQTISEVAWRSSHP